jgi:hypothetical protein
MEGIKFRIRTNTSVICNFIDFTTEFNVRQLQSSTMVIGATVGSSSLLQELKKWRN